MEVQKYGRNDAMLYPPTQHRWPGDNYQSKWFRGDNIGGVAYNINDRFTVWQPHRSMKSSVKEKRFMACAVNLSVKQKGIVDGSLVY